ncbi:hypothetical protein EI171_32800 [Bradyrhizobium sp. LCT2]|nr:hypothetical protein EI171_32800 [Bradyrhizobium sp. LCT2]
MMKLGLTASREAGTLPLPLAGEGWGEGVSAVGFAKRIEPSPGASAPTSPASGRGDRSRREIESTKSHQASARAGDPQRLLECPQLI